LKVGYIGPSPLLSTGLGKTARYLLRGLKERGYEIGVANPQFAGYPIEIEGMRHYPLVDFSLIGAFFDDFKPDLVFAWGPNWVEPYRRVASICSAENLNLLWMVTLEFGTVSLDLLMSLVGANKVATTSLFAAKILSKHNIDAAHVPLGCDHSIYRPVNPKPKFEGYEDFFAFGTVQRNTLRKELSVVLKAYSMLPQIVKDESIFYLHTLPFEENLGQVGWNIPELVMRFGIAGNVLMPSLASSKYLGLPEDEMCKIYNALDVYLSISSGEGFCLPLLEAMACGTPVIVSKNTSQPEVVEDAGLYAECFDDPEYTAESFTIWHTKTKSVKKQMLRLYEDENLRKALSRRAFERARLFTWERSVSCLEKAIEEAMRSKRLDSKIVCFEKPVEAYAYEERLVKYIPEGRGRCLDVGCGTHRPFLKAIEQKGYEWVGIDKKGGKHIMKLDITKPLPFKNGEFEFAFCNHVIEHIPTARQLKVLEELKRVAKHGCIIFPKEDDIRMYVDPAHHEIDKRIFKEGECLEEMGNVVVRW